MTTLEIKNKLLDFKYNSENYTFAEFYEFCLSEDLWIQHDDVIRSDEVLYAVKRRAEEADDLDSFISGLKCYLGSVYDFGEPYYRVDGYGNIKNFDSDSIALYVDDILDAFNEDYKDVLDAEETEDE